MTALKIWKTKSADADFARQLARELKLPPILADVLSGYGFADIAAVERFLNPKLKDVSDPFLIPQMEAAVRRIWRAVDKGEKILVFGDYDVDGVTSAALMFKALGSLGALCLKPCLPNRLDDGYGLTVEALQRGLEKEKPDLIVTVDCGTTAHAAAKYIKAQNIDLIITDHHELSPEMPEALAVINPKLGDSDALKMLSGVGVAFMLCCALVKYGRTRGFDLRGIELKDYLDLVALGTVADVVPLLCENRIFARHGLAHINKFPSPAWEALRSAASLNGRLDAYHLSFCVAPRLNAAGRLDTADAALELFMTGDKKRAGDIANRLDQANRERQAIEKRILSEAIAEIDGYFDEKMNFGLVVGKRGWHVGVIGIVASRLTARYNRPAIVIGFDEDGAGRGSARSIEGYNILDGLHACVSCLTGCGGHEMAAGLEMNEAQLDALRKNFNRVASEKLKNADLRKVQPVNAWIGLDEVSEENLEELERLAPFGQNNLKPVFAARKVKITGQPRVMAEKHLRFNVSDGKETVAAVAFNQAGREIPNGELDVAFQIRKNSFNGSENLELNVLDFRKTNA